MLVFLSAHWFAPLVSEAATLAPRAPIRLRISYSSPIGVMAPLWMAAESGAFKREALDVEMVLVEGRAAIAALIFKEVDAVRISMPAIVPAAITGTPCLRTWRFESSTGCPLLFTRCIHWLTPLPRQCFGISATGAHRRENVV